jgi:hypothetical protein
LYPLHEEGPNTTLGGQICTYKTINLLVLVQSPLWLIHKRNLAETRFRRGTGEPLLDNPAEFL